MLSLMVGPEGKFVDKLPEEVIATIDEGVRRFVETQKAKLPDGDFEGKGYGHIWIISAVEKWRENQFRRCVRIGCYELTKGAYGQKKDLRAYLVPGISLMQKGGDSRPKELLSEPQINLETRYLKLGGWDNRVMHLKPRVEAIEELLDKLQEPWRYVMGIAVPERFLGN